GVTVELYNNLGVLVDTDVTDSLGDYEFVDVTPGDYSIVVVYPGATFVAAGPDSDVDAAGQSPTFTAGGTTTNVADAGVLPASMSSSVWLDLDGDGVLNGADTPVVGVTVELRDSLGNVVATTLTDSSGDYTFSDLAPGSDYTVTVVAALATFATIGDADTDASGLADPVALLSGTNSGSGDAAVLPVVIGDFVWLDLDGNGTQDLGEPGIEGATVEVFDSGGSLVTSSVTDADGNYDFSLFPGSYEVVVTAPGGGTFTAQTLATSDGSDVDASGSTGVLGWGSGDLTAAADAGVLPADIGGVVWLDEDVDGLNGAEPLVAGIVVNLFDGLGSLVASTITAADGTYAFAGLVPGDYVVRVVSGGVGFTAQGGDSDVDTTTGEASIAAAGSHSISAGLLPGFISGTVWSDIDGDGVNDLVEDGVGGVSVSLYDTLGVLVATTTTDGAGLYSFGPLGPGIYNVVVDGSGFPAGTTVTSDPDATLDGQTSLTLATTNVGVDFGYQPPATVSGVVFSDLDGDGIADPGEPGLGGVSVTITHPGGIITLVTGADGSYSAIVTPGPVDVDVDSTTVPGPAVLTTGNDPQSLTAVADSIVTAGATGYQPVGSVVGSLWFDVDAEGTIATGEPLVGGVLIELVNSSGTVVASTTTAADGSYRFDDVPLGTYTVSVAGTPPWGIVPVVSPSVVVTAGESKADLPLVGTETFAGTLFEDANENGIQDPGEDPIVGATVTLTWHGPDGIAGTADDIVYSTVTDNDGEYEFTMLPEGDFSVVIESTGLPPTVTPPPAAVVSITGGSCVTSTGSSCDNVPNVTLRPAVDLTVSITPDVENVAVGDLVVWTIEVLNNGPGTAEGPIEVIVTLPEGVEFVSMEGADWEVLEVDGVRVLVAHVDSLPEGGTSIFHITSRVVVLSASLQAMVTVGGASPEANLANNADVASLGALPFTGLATKTLGITGMLLLGAGVVLLAAARRRERWIS
ncbi:MAG: hypothetical protein HKN07_05765, partial [Acidimicrobiia bacterium]|nr:hypothetical protein [Acidimicrobiia bacterium]